MKKLDNENKRKNRIMVNLKDEDKEFVLKVARQKQITSSTAIELMIKFYKDLFSKIM